MCTQPAHSARSPLPNTGRGSTGGDRTSRKCRARSSRLARCDGRTRTGGTRSRMRRTRTPPRAHAHDDGGPMPNVRRHAKRYTRLGAPGNCSASPPAGCTRH
eukprot:2363205-Prymnesium_polylepis.1